MSFFQEMHLHLAIVAFLGSSAQVVNIAAAGGRLIGSLGSILAVLGRGTGPKREEMAGRFTGVDSQDLATILDPFRGIFVDLGPDRLSAA